MIRSDTECDIKSFINCAITNVTTEVSNHRMDNGDLSRYRLVDNLNFFLSRCKYIAKTGRSI